MLWHRRILLVAVLLGVGGSLSAALSYSLYLRSDHFRRRVEQRVSTLLEMPVHIGRVRPLSADSRSFQQITVSQPATGTDVFRCERAVWSDEVLNGRSHYGLDLIDGWLLVGTHQWTRADYRALLRSGLGQDFPALGLRRVHLTRIDLEWQHPDITLTVYGAIGEMLFDEDGTGRASLRAYNLNGQPVADPILIFAGFTPGSGLRFHEASLDLPAIPFRDLGLDRLLQSKVEHGTFKGRLLYRNTADGQAFELSGSVEAASLAELTAPLAGGPFHGRVDVTIDQALFRNGRLDALRFRGQVGDVKLTELLPMLGSTSLDSAIDLRIHQANLCGSFVDYFSASGQATDAPLEAICRLIGRGTVTGKLRVRIASLLVVDDVLKRAEIELSAVPPDDGPGTIDKTLLQWAAKEILGLDLSTILPSKVEYARLGARLIVEGEHLRVRGTHGHDGKTLLTVRIFGREVPLVREFDRVYEVGPLVSNIRKRLEAYELSKFRNWWQATHAAPPESPQE
ncbi:MAG: hypothetical protein ACE5GE_00805 [Phycisphaerae bacterium]